MKQAGLRNTGAVPDRQLSLLFDELDHAPTAAPPGLNVGAPLHSTAPSPMDVAPSAHHVPTPPARTAYLHPQASRRIELEGHLVGYELRRARRRTIGFLVGPEGVTVAAPRWVSVGDVEVGLREKSRWIVRKLQEQGERNARLAAARVEWREGTCLPFLGRSVRLVLDPAQAGAVFDAAQGTLTIGLPHHAQPAQLRDAVQAWLMRQATRVFTERLDHFAPQLGVRWRRLSLSNAATRWGSASADGAIRLNWRLVHYSPALIDYVVAHELSHLRVMNHSPAFWDTVASVMPDYHQRRSQLRDEHLPVF
jgi:predicted metal-dependent hydrolase